eukprot:TRINITY_DN7711_c0_g1_i1.p1 TRINITY_DN7711_c0_g1~~TRINITY_DN7711_c0_g1_i1.p1  ORF type:complete len:248 (+),score=-26.97 TRINITY_DN7711_c0_g1_i1:601-1344(+)
MFQLIQKVLITSYYIYIQLISKKKNNNQSNLKKLKLKNRQKKACKKTNHQNLIIIKGFISHFHNISHQQNESNIFGCNLQNNIFISYFLREQSNTEQQSFQYLSDYQKKSMWYCLIRTIKQYICTQQYMYIYIWTIKNTPKKHYFDNPNDLMDPKNLLAKLTVQINEGRLYIHSNIEYTQILFLILIKQQLTITVLYQLQNNCKYEYYYPKIQVLDNHGHVQCTQDNTVAAFVAVFWRLYCTNCLVK